MTTSKQEKMKKEDLRIVFMGTPHFAVESLKILIESNYNVVGVITVADKQAGRGRKIMQSAVKQYSEEIGLTVLQPLKLKSPEFIEQLKLLKADLQIVVAFRMLPEIVWDMPRFGTFNLHASLLPQYRGAAPINRAIMNGEKQTGVTTFFLNHEIDKGKIIFNEKVDITAAENAGSLHDRLMTIGANLVRKTVDAIIEGSYSETLQSELINDKEELKNAPKIFPEDCRINWSCNTTEIINHIRGLNPYPVAWAKIIDESDREIQIKIFEAKSKSEEHKFSIGTIISDGKDFLKVAIPDGYLLLLYIQLAGKKRMLIQDFLRGFKHPEKYRFE